MSYLRLDGTSQNGFQIGGAGVGPIWITGLVWPPTSESTSNPLVALNAYDPTETFLVPVRVGDAQQATDAVNLQTLQGELAKLVFGPGTGGPSSSDLVFRGLYEGGWDSSPPTANGSLYG